MEADHVVKNSPTREGRSSVRAPADATSAHDANDKKDEQVIGLEFTNERTFYLHVE